LEGETPPNSNVLFLVIFENDASTPFYEAIYSTLNVNSRINFEKLSLSGGILRGWKDMTGIVQQMND
jgi:hypothetical protein